MNVPPAELIETAVAEVDKLPSSIMAEQLHELHAAVGDKDGSFMAGYLLGIQTARVMLSRSVVPDASEIL